ncbi:MAG TPA: hypothetical protein VGP97_07900 [Burkholderiales bacterium]|jgi:predicted AlkP superfamily pyrophosphatase or phosphodiesterase|nr:hypothetical protein [Burkholderiales bacterium]
MHLRSIAASAVLFTLAVAAQTHAAPRVVLISLDGATPGFVEQFVRDGTLPRDSGLGLLMRTGLSAERNVTVNPSLTAAAHIAMLHERERRDRLRLGIDVRSGPAASISFRRLRV